MDIKTITDLISAVGFPIVVCLILFWFIKTYLDKLIGTLGDFQESLNDNSVQLKRVSENLEAIKNVRD